MDPSVTITSGYVFFWNGWPSQWHFSRFTIGDFEYNCAEQFMMAEKARVFDDQTALDCILASNDPEQQKSFGRRVRNFNADVWNTVCRGIVFRGNFAKFTQNDRLGGLLRNTGDRVIVEASPMDAIWGIGLAQNDPRALDCDQWLGTNWLGIAIMQVRDEMRRLRDEPHRAFDQELHAQLEARRSLPGA